MNDDSTRRWLAGAGLTPENQTQARGVDPEHKKRALTLFNKAHQNYQKGRYFTATQPLKELIELLEFDFSDEDPALVDALILLGDCSFYVHMLEDARIAYERVLTLDDRFMIDEYTLYPVLDHLAQILSTRGEKERAQALANRARSIKIRFGFDMWDPQGSRIGRKVSPTT